MRRMLMGIALALGSIAAMAGPPTPPTASVAVVNTPLPVTVAPNASLPVTVEGQPLLFAETVIPFDKLSGLGHPLSCVFRRIADPPPFYYYDASTACFSSATALPDGLLIRQIRVAPNSVDTYLDGTYSAASCQMSYFLSIDGVNFTRITHAIWTPGQWETQIHTLPVPIAIPEGGSVTQKIELAINGGKQGQGCGVAVRVFGSIP